MPFFGQDPRGPGFCWYKSDASNSWKVLERNDVLMDTIPRSEVRKAIGAYLQHVLDKKHRSLYTTLSAAPDSKSSVKENQKWIQIGSRASKEVHGYSTTGELFRRLDFESAVSNELRFQYILRVVELIVYHKLYSLSGSALVHLFNLIDHCLVHVHESFNEIRAMKRLLNGLMSSLQRQSRDKLFCSKTLWLQCISRVRVWQKELKQIQVPRRVDFGLTLTDLPWELQHKVATCLIDDFDVVSLSKVNRTFSNICEQNSVWKNLCYTNFKKENIDKLQIGTKMSTNPVKRLESTNIENKVNNSSENVFPTKNEWKEHYYELKKNFEIKERSYHHGLLFCKSCSILFWEECRHPCIRKHTDPNAEIEKISPVQLLTLF